MVQLIRTDSQNRDFRHLVHYLDRELAERDGDDHAFYHQFNKIDKIKHVVVAYLDHTPAGCGAIKEYESGVAEVKRMFVLANQRRMRIASQLLKELEQWAAELNYHTLILETGQAQPEAIALYRKSGYQQIPNYGQYAGVENSVCMKKTLWQEQQPEPESVL
ncbi:acetyltransferase, N-acetylglutamate synthase [Flammeovirgaceae bacterium 311]|nr:acetyltransferase, N-acetylglutamate synthase [Flammeovirgaceae bacterium 311]